MKFIVRLLLTALSLLLVANIVPGIEIVNLWIALIAAFCLGILNAVTRPILVFFTLPITFLTLGLFIFVINAALFFFVASLIDGFYVAGFWSALIGSILVSILSGIAHKLAK